MRVTRHKGTPPDGPIIRRDYLDHLVEQLGFLDSSCDAFDSGNSAEAKRLATIIRVLVHDTGNSVSLLTHLDVKTEIPWADGIVLDQLKTLIEEEQNGRRAFTSLLTTIKMGAGFLKDHSLVKYVPVFEIQPVDERYVTFDYWWTTTRIVDSNFTPISRRQIVLWLSNKDGGAHIDAHLPPAYAEVARGSSMGITLSRLDGKSSKDDNPIPAAMRQIAEEVRHTIRRFLSHLIEAQAILARDHPE
ncbi:hypothetical protein J7E29_15040 [Streptomyces sp. ISL-90]|nr:hypothetical protein [Streptomyces sp. ISL-90]